MHRIHVCLVSAQPIPNLIPLRMDELRPQEVILLVSPDMKVQAKRLEDVITSWGIKVKHISIAPYDLDSARETCMNLLLENEDNDVILNATGGTKLMAFAAFEVFRELERPVIYVDTQNQWIQVLSPYKRQINFKGVLKVPQYLKAYGQILLNERKPYEKLPQHIPILNELVKFCERYQMAVRTLNRYWSLEKNEKDFPLEIELDTNHKTIEGFQDLLELYKKYGIIDYLAGKILVPSIEDLKFLSGGWLEEYVFYTVKSLNVTDVRLGVEVMWDMKASSPPLNEYDVVFTHNNRLFLIECKTKTFRDFSLNDKNEDLVYKLESLRDAAGGVYGKGMLVSFQKLTDSQKKRLAANRLAFCDGSNLKDLRSVIAKWIA